MSRCNLSSRSFLFSAALLLTASASSAAVRVLEEGVPSSNKEFVVSTTTRRVNIATTTYSGAVPSVGLHITSNTVLDTAAVKDAIILYSTGSGKFSGVVFSSGIILNGTVGSLSPDRQDATLQVIGSGLNGKTIMSCFNPSTTGECGFAYDGQNSSAVVSGSKMVSFSGYWVDPSSMTGYGAMRLNAEYYTGGVGADGQDIRIAGNHGITFFGASDTDFPGSQNIQVRGNGGTTLKQQGGAYGPNGLYAVFAIDDSTSVTHGLTMGYDNSGGFISGDGSNAGVAIIGRNGSTLSTGVYVSPTGLTSFPSGLQGVITSSTPIPSVSCNAGTGVMLANSSSQSGFFTAGTLATSCTVTFATGSTFPKQPSCFCNGSIAGLLVNATASATNSVTCGASTALTGDTVNYICWSSP